MMTDPTKLKYKTANGKLAIADQDRGITLICRPTRIATVDKDRVAEVYTDVILLQLVLHEPQWNIDAVIAFGRLLSDRGVEVTLRHT